jgi:hypothetical protein
VSEDHERVSGVHGLADLTSSSEVIKSRFSGPFAHGHLRPRRRECDGRQHDGAGPVGAERVRLGRGHADVGVPDACRMAPARTRTTAAPAVRLRIWRCSAR